VKRDEFEHVLRAAADLVKDELVVVGSQAVLGEFPDPPPALVRSVEVALYPRQHTERADAIDANIGDGSRFHETFEYYAHAVGRELPIAPAGWEERLVRVDVPATAPKGGAVVAWCMAIHDLVLAKLAAGRPHDLEYVDEAIRAGLVDVDQLHLGLELMPDTHREPTRERLEGAVSRAARRSA